jgi:Ca2+-binding RTX toxin-like protein/pimeloyl-ACP methyl ester carboxylesterase
MSSAYLYDVIAKTNDSVASGGNLTGLELFTSINDSGTVAFVGKFGTPEDLLVGDGTNPLKNLSTDSTFVFDNFSSGLEINNNNQVAAIDRATSGFSAIRLYDVNTGGLKKTIGIGKFPIVNEDFENILGFPSLSNNPGDVVAFLATPKDQFPLAGLETFAGYGLFNKKLYNELVLAANSGGRPAIADDGKVVIRNPLGTIVIYNYQLNPIALVASSSQGFNSPNPSVSPSVGPAPGISNDGKAVVFYGDLDATGAEALKLTPGRGIFVSLETDSGRILQRIAGIAGNGFLDPGETFQDNNGNGKVDAGEDLGLISSFAYLEKLGINFNETDDGGYGTAAFLGIDTSGKKSLFSSQFNISSSPNEPTTTTVSHNSIAKVGQLANNVSPGLTGDIQDISIYDPINTKGQIAFWAKTTTNQEAVVRANPIRKPVLLLPGIGGSFPENADFRQWLLNRGVAPDTLRIDPLANVYSDLIETLKRSGYREGVDLFVATYDWRLDVGPDDGKIDGKINRTAEALTNDTYEYSVDQLGFWLEEAIKGWKSQFVGLPPNQIPNLDSVDIISHSTGGLVARTYIQSDAYGESFTYKDDSGNDITANLPKIDNLITVGVPNRGASLAWNPLNNNILSNIPITLLSFLTARAAYQKITKTVEPPEQPPTIAFNGRVDSPFAITPPPAGTELDPIEFIERYVPTLKTLLATYPFIDPLPNTQNLISAESFNPSKKNTLLLDLNNGFDSVAQGTSPYPNGFVNKVEQVTVIHGVNVETPDAVTERDRPDTLIGVGPVNLPKPTVFPIDGSPFPQVPNGIWYRNETGRTADNPNRQGDGTLPLISARDQFLLDSNPKIKLEPFIQNRSGENEGNTDGAVDHSSLMSNTDAQKLILETLGVNINESLISTGLANPSYWDVASIISSLIFDPVEGFLVDSQGRRLGYSQATGAVTEIPNSFWLGQDDGIGLINGAVKGPVKLQLTGLGEDYSVSVGVQTENGPAGIEIEGFLAQGEQKTFDIPVNNAPLLDLNGSTDGLDASASLVIPAQTITLNDPNNPLTITDTDSPNLQGATVTISNPQDGTSESLSATSTGNIAVAYDPATKTLTLSGSDTIANYQQVLRSITYTNIAATPNLTPREITFEVNDGAGFNNLSPIATTTLTLDLTLNGTTGNDTLVGNNGNDTLNGEAGNDQLEGKAGNDLLNGGTGDDTLIGDTGNDIYIVDSTGDLVTETSTTITEIDRVEASISYTLGSNLENLTLTGTSAIDGMGNSFNNAMIGNAAINTLTSGDGNDTLDGGAGNDTLIGDTGNDLYLINNLGDVINEISTIATEIDSVRASVSYTLSSNIETLTLIGTAAINGAGNALNNTITGNTANNILNGVAGNDTMTGGLGNDTYYVDSLGDVVSETSILATEIDTVISAVTYTLGANLENLTLSGAVAINGTGNSLNNRLVGNTANNILNGGTGNDTMTGGVGNDVYYVNSLGDVVSETSILATEIDTVISAVTYTLGANLENLTLSGAVAINGTGNTLNNRLVGNTANNSLIGGVGNDTMTGGAGNDVYNVDSLADVVSETSIVATEIDIVNSSVNYTLGANLERLILIGTAAINGVGNNLNNAITGNTANNILNGGLGNDTLTGGTGDDIYYVDSLGDVVSETSPEATEIDTVISAVTYTLGANVENLTLSGTVAINGVGNNLNNAITGNTANNTLNGGLGNDTLTGGTGNDIYNVDSLGDVVTETSTVATEIDTVFSTVIYTLGANLENLTLSGIAAINGTGNSLNNTITGNTANNSLNGGLGNDTLTLFCHSRQKSYKSSPNNRLKNVGNQTH